MIKILSKTKTFIYKYVFLRTMEIISKISKGSKMDQVYIPKNRMGFSTGSYVVLKPLGTEKIEKKPFFYNVSTIEPIKLSLVNNIFNILSNTVENYSNILITGSFLEKGFNFNDIDIILISEDKIDAEYCEIMLNNNLGIKFHVILIDNKTLVKGLSTDPLYQMMLSRCISKNRFIYKTKPKFNYKILDLHLIQSKTLIDNFDFLTGDEKYKLVRNLISIDLFIKNKKVTNEIVDSTVRKIFGHNTVDKLKKNILVVKKKKFLNKYKKLYDQLFDKILKGVKNRSKQK